MNVLYLDIGNSRIKWMTDDAPMQAITHQGAVAETVASLVADCAPSRVVAVDVTATLPQGLPDGLPLRLFTAAEPVAGLVNGYAQPGRLGADRWAAVLGAWHEGEAVLVIDAGTAITADLVDDSGHHLGGWIAPGRALATGALTTSTRGIRLEAAPDDRPTNPGTDTTQAVASGTLLAITGFAVQTLAAAVEVLRATPRIVVTGGDAAVVATALSGSSVVEDLVLRGLKRWDGKQG